jgi:hypothetical protein
MYLYQLTAVAAGPCVLVFQASSELNVALSNLAAVATNVLAGVTSTSVPAAPEAAPAAASVPAPDTAPTPAAAKIEYIQEAGPDEDFDAVCKRLQIYVLPGKKYLMPGEKLVVHMYKEGKKSLLVTNRGRLIWCVAIGSKNYCLDYPLGMDKNVS